MSEIPYTPTTWINYQSPALSAANLNKLTDELESQAAAKGITHSLPTWVNDAPPALTDAAPLNEMERITALVAASVGLSYTKTTWSAGWVPARNAARLNGLELQAQANRAAIEVPPPSGRPPLPPGDVWTGQQVITTGGTYEVKAWASSGPSVIVQTSQPVTLNGWVKNLNGSVLIAAIPGGAVQLTVESLHAYGGPSWQTSGRFIETNNHKSLVVRNCTITNTRGIELEGGSASSTCLITRNKHKNAQGNVISPVGNLVQFRICQNSTIEVSWNEMVNEYNLSAPEDLVSVLASYNVDIHDNFFYGQSTPGNAYSTSSQNGITIEVNSNNVNAHNNQLIAGMAIGIFGGSNCSFHNNRIVRSGFLTDGVTVNQNGYEGVWIASGLSNCHAHGNVVGYINKDFARNDGRFLGAPEGDAGEWLNNTHMPAPISLAVEQNEWTIWQNKLFANNITLGA